LGARTEGGDTLPVEVFGHCPDRVFCTRFQKGLRINWRGDFLTFAVPQLKHLKNVCRLPLTIVDKKE